MELISGYRASYICTVYKQKPDKYRCIWSSKDRISFYVEIQTIFGIVYEYGV